MAFLTDLGGRLLLGAQVVGPVHGGPPLGVRGEQGVDQGLVVPPGALAGADEVGVVAEEAQVDHPLMVGGGPRGAFPPGGPGQSAGPDRAAPTWRLPMLPRPTHRG